jgi:hypothetical protein
MKAIIKIGKSTRVALKLIIMTVILVMGASSLFARNNDTTATVSFSGKITDSETKKALVYASVLVEGTNIGTIANSDGEYLLKVPKNKANGKVCFTHLGYKTLALEISNLKAENNTVALQPEIVSLQEIIVRLEDPATLIKEAVTKISRNYSKTPAMYTGFYREAIQQNKKYVSIAEAVLGAYKASYSNMFTDDKVKVLYGRKSQDVKKMDTIVVKLQGGPLTPFFLDIAKNPENVFNEEFFKNYDLKLSGQISLDNERCYIIEFEQRKNVNLPLYKGKIFIEVESLAITAIEYGLSEFGLEYASSMFVKKKPLTMRTDILGADYFVKYTKNNDKWTLNYVRSELRFKCKWKKNFFASSYNIMSEMAVTDIDETNVEKIKAAESFKQSDIFSDKAEAFKDDNFWGDYNIILPDESIQSAIKKLNKKLSKQK